MRYLVRTYDVPQSEEDRASARLWALGTLGVEVRADGDRIRLEAWFAESVNEPPALGERRVDERWVAAEDWMAEHRAVAEPIPVGDRFLVDPREPGADLVDAGSRSLLRLPARTAFGTGSHESTRLAVAWIERIQLGGRCVLDVGCGSGILSFVALRCGARTVIGYDIDAAAGLMAGQYAELNRMDVPLYVGDETALGPTARFDVAVVNVLHERVASAIPAIVRLVAVGGEVVVSGVLTTQAAEVLDAWRRSGAHPVGRRDEGEWSAWRLAVGEGSAP